VGTAALAASIAGLSTTAGPTVVSIQRWPGRRYLRDLAVIPFLAAAYLIQLLDSTRLLTSAAKPGALRTQAVLVIVFFLIAIASAWQLIGARSSMLVSIIAETASRQRAGGTPDPQPSGQPGSLPPPKSRPGRGITLVTAYEAGDVAALVALLTDDAVITAPLAAGAYVGPTAAARVFEAIFARDRSYRLIATRANGQPAFGLYVRDPATAVFHANGMLVVTLAGDRIRAMTRFDNSVIAKFGLPRRLP
jgi:hypothetical protein